MPPSEAMRIQLLHALNLLDTDPEPAFDRITRLLARTLDVPIALITLVDRDRQWFKSAVGMSVKETPREHAFCAHTIRHGEMMIIADAMQDARFARNPLVLGDPRIRFYAGVPLMTRHGHALGSLCAIDTRPRSLDEEERQILQDLADLVMREIHAREAALLTRSQMAQADEEIQAYETLFRTVYERAGVGIGLLSRQGRWISVNETLSRTLDYSVEELVRKGLADIVLSTDASADRELLDRLASGSMAHYQGERQCLKGSGEALWVNLMLTRQMNARGQLEYFVAVIKDIQARKEVEASLEALRRELEQQVETRTRDLRKREAELSAVLEHAEDAYIGMDQAGIVTAWNHKARETFGWSDEEALGRPIEQLIIPEQLREAYRDSMRQFLLTGQARFLGERLEMPARRRDGAIITVEVRVNALEVDGQAFFSAFMHEITERKLIEQRREKEALQDALTGLPNRRALLEELPRSMADAQRDGATLALMFLDLDGFKQVNDSLGHAAGDVLLQQIAARLHASVRESDRIYRLAGDEFTVVLRSVGGLDKALAVAEKLIREVGVRVPIEQHLVQVGASIGVSLFAPGDRRTAEQLLEDADSAMYQAKREGKGCHAVR